MANIRKQRNFIHALHGRNTIACSQKEKEDLVFSHFHDHVGKNVPISCLLNLSELDWQPRDLGHLDLPFSEEELKKLIMEIHKEKAPGPDGFIGLFFSHCWQIIKDDIASAVNQFYNLNQQGLQFLNQAFIVLIPKKENPQAVSDFRPISLTRRITKIITMMFANRLAPSLDSLISYNQTTFIKERCIHDNLMYVQEVIKDLHKRKVPSLFIKLDMVSWHYLLHTMEHLGFPQRWRNWISSLWCTTSSSILVNGVSSKRVFHYRGVRQGDPLSPMLFLLAMEPLHKLIAKAQEAGLLSSLSRSYDTFRMSLYVDVDAIFIKPTL
jgi:hypothetical protein